MRRFERQPDGTLRAELDGEEALLLQSLAGQVSDVVASGIALAGAVGAGDSGDEALSDPAVARLLPDAYMDDPEASAEFRRFTVDTLIGRKLRNADVLIRSLDDAAEKGEGVVSLDGEAAQAWLRSLTDIRLTIAARLGIDSEDDDAGREADPMMRDIYDWLGFVQNSLVEALDDSHE